MQREQVGVLAAQAVEQGGDGGGDGSGAAEAEGGVNVAVDGEVEAACGRGLAQCGDDVAQFGVVGEVGEVGAVFAEGALDVDLPVGARGEVDADALVDGADDGGRAVNDGVFAGNHDAAGGAGGQGLGHGCSVRG